MLRLCKYCGQTFDGDPGATACQDCVEARKHNVMAKRTCRTCGVVFDGGPRAWYCPSCRAERRRQHDREAKERKRMGTTRLIGGTAYCVACGDPYIVSSGTQRYCPICAPDKIREAANALSATWNRAHTTPEERREARQRYTAPIECVICGRPFNPDLDALTCSKSCSEDLARRNATKFEEQNREARNAYHRQLYKNKMDAMTEDERKKHREQVNAKARENYRKRRENQK